MKENEITYDDLLAENKELKKRVFEAEKEINNSKLLNKSEQFLKSIFDHSPTAMMICEAPDGRITYINDAVWGFRGETDTRMTNITVEEYVMTWKEFYPDGRQYSGEEMPLARSLINGETVENEQLIVRLEDGTEKWAAAWSAPIYDNSKNIIAAIVLFYDITEHKLMENTLAVSGSAAGIWDWDIVINKLDTSPHFKKLIGYESDEIDISIDVFFNLLHPEDLDKVQLGLERHLKERLDYDVDYRMQAKSGEYRWFHARGQALWDKEGKATRMSGSISDITQRKNAEADLIKSNKLSRDLIEQSPLPIEILSTEGKIIQVNSAWKKMWKVSDEEAAETLEKYNMLTDPQLEKLGVMDEVKKAFKGKHIILPPVKYDTSQTKDDFDIKHLKSFRAPWTQCHLNAAKDIKGKILYVVNAYVDITDLKEAEEILIKSENRYRHLVEHSPLSISIFTEEGKLNQVNTAWKNLWGLSDKETLQVMENYNIFTDKQMEESGHAPMVVSAFKGADIIIPPMEYKGDITTKEIALDDIKSQSRWIQSHFYSVQHANGDLDYVVNINMDLTELKKAEKESDRQKNILAPVSRSRSMGQLTGSIAHELNQPLTGILSNAQAGELLLKNKPCDETEIKEILAEIISDTKRAGDLIRNLRRLYQNQVINLLPIKINKVIEEVTKLLHSEIVIKNVDLTTKYASSIPIIKGNRVQIQQILVNLIMNGIQAMDYKEREDRKLLITSSFNANEVKVFVEDNGKGINPDIIDRIFEPLATWKPDGTGMGLAVSNTIIGAHGGRMIAKNSTKGGARVGFSIPIIKEKA